MSGRKLKTQKSQGFATLLFTMIVLASITAFAFLSANAVITKQHSVRVYHEEQSAFNIAQAGLDYAIPYLSANYATITNGSSQQMSLPGGGYATVQFAFVGDKNTIRLTSVGRTAGGQTSASVQQLVKYNSNTAYKTLGQAAVARSGLFMGSAYANIKDNEGHAVTVRLGTSASVVMGSGKTYLNNIVSSSKTRGADIVTDSSFFAGLSTNQIETNVLGKTIANLAAVTTDGVVANTPGVPGVSATSIGATINSTTYSKYSYSALTNNGTRNSVTINQNGPSAAIIGGTYGSPTKPFVIKANLSGSAKGEDGQRPSLLVIQGNTVIYGDVIVEGGDVVLDQNVIVYGNVIANGSTVQIQNSTVNGAIISSGNTSLFYNSKVNGIVYAGGDFRTFSASGASTSIPIVNGAVFSNAQLRIGNTPIVYDPGYPNNSVVGNPAFTNASGLINYDSSLARFAVPNSGNGTYSRVAGSWSDI